MQIKNYRIQNQLPPIEHLDVVLENYWCSLPENEGLCLPMKLARGFRTSVFGGVALVVKWLKGDFVTDEVANERANQCVKCPNNYFPDKGPFVQWSDQVALEMVGNRRVALHNELGSCAVCSCPLRAKVFVAGPFKLEPQWKPEMEKVNCWQLKEEKK